MDKILDMILIIDILRLFSNKKIFSLMYPTNFEGYP
jgi:hypothetical protein